MAEKSCFEEFATEDISLCPQNEIQAGIAEEIYYIPVEHVASEGEMSTGKTFADSVTRTGDIVPIAGKGFKKLKLQVDLNGLKSSLVGNKGNKKTQTTLEAFLPGVRAVTLGFQKQMKNVGVILLVPDLNGQLYQVGTKLASARFDNIDADTGKTLEDNNGITLTVVSNSSPIVYEGKITTEPVLPGG